MVELLIPIGRRPVVNSKDVPWSFKGQLSGAFKNTDQAKDIAYMLGGRDAKPNKPVMLWGPSGMSIIIIGAGVADAAEIEDIALAQIAKQEESIKKVGTPVDFNALREKNRQLRSEDVDVAIRDALRRRAQDHLRNPISDPPRIPGRKRDGTPY